MRVAEILRDRIIALIDKGIIPWRRPWSVAGSARNAAGRPYRGINVWLLNGTREASGYNRNAWATYRDVAARGWTVRKGEHGTPVLFWKVNSYLKTVKDNATGEQRDETARGFVMRYYTVFNLDQTTAPEDFAGVIMNQNETHADAQSIADTYLGREGSPALSHGGDVAYYDQVAHAVRMPELGRFDGTAAYYATLYHELGHSTGLALGRPMIPADRQAYSREELVAEFTATHLCSLAGLEYSLEPAAAYIAGWRAKLQEEPEALIFAAAQAEKAVRFILTGSPEEPEREHTTDAARARWQEYVHGIRNDAKREYAIAYGRYRFGSAPHPEPPEGLGCMGAQAVRLEAESIYRAHVGKEQTQSAA